MDGDQKPRLTGNGAFRRNAGLTLVELLVVLAVIVLLASLLVPPGGNRGVALKKSAQVEMKNIGLAIDQYESTYGRVPASSQAIRAAAPDFTFGTYQAGAAPTLTPVPRKKGKAQIQNNGGIGYQAPNSEVMAILMDLVTTPEGTPTANTNHALNSGRISFISPRMAQDTHSWGVGPDLVFRDPWGNPYLISLDVNKDGKVRDAFYSLQSVSAGSAFGFTQATAGTDSWEGKGNVMVWSLGPDGEADPKVPANAGMNKDNILSW